MDGAAQRDYRKLDIYHQDSESRTSGKSTRAVSLLPYSVINRVPELLFFLVMQAQPLLGLWTQLPFSAFPQMLCRLNIYFLLRSRVQSLLHPLYFLYPRLTDWQTYQINRQANKSKTYPHPPKKGRGDWEIETMRSRKYFTLLAVKAMSKFIYTTYIHLGLLSHCKDINAAKNLLSLSVQKVL